MSEAKWKSISPDLFKQYVEESHSYAELARKTGYLGGSANISLKQAINYYNLSDEHFIGQGWNKNNFDYSRFRYGNNIKADDMKDALIYLRGHKCENCGLEQWQNKPIPLEVHHIDGNHINTELNNLQLLCPNCHALTDNWRGKNISKKNNQNMIPEEKIKEALENNVSVRQALLSVGLSGCGGNYTRAYDIINKYHIEKFLKK